MRTSPHRPLILKRRRLPLPVKDVPGETPEEDPRRSLAPAQAGPSQAPKEGAEAGDCQFPAGIKIINHPTMPNTQVVVIPHNANIQSIITALTAKGKESGSSGPNKFILISCGGGPPRPSGLQPQAPASQDPRRTKAIPETLGPKPAARDGHLPRPPPPAAFPGNHWERSGMWAASLSPLLARTMVNPGGPAIDASSPAQGQV